MSESQALWSLDEGRALRMTLDGGPRELHVLEGRLWLTTTGTLGQPGVDVWLQPGESLALAAGDELVIEPWKGQARFQLLVPPSACPQLARQLRLSRPSGASVLAASPAC